MAAAGGMPARSCNGILALDDTERYDSWRERFPLVHHIERIVRRFTTMRIAGSDGGTTQFPDALVSQVYRPTHALGNWSFTQFVGHDRVFYFSLGREALRAAMAAIGVRPAENVLVPSFICRDVVDAIIAARARPVYYRVGRSLSLDDGVDTLPASRVVIAVNYFGIPQTLAPFHAYRERTGAVLIEDNAHGLLSRDAHGRLLGTRGDVGLFSLRKTLPLQDGAALAINNVALASRLVLPEVSGSTTTSWRWRLKRLARALVSAAGVRGLRAVIAAGRYLRDALPHRPRHDSRPLADAAWRPSAPYADFQHDLAQTDPMREATRRRELYQWLHEYMRAVPCTPVFDELDAYTVPYGYPFHAEPEHLPRIRRHLARAGLDCFSWPDLPDDVRATAPDWYKNIWCVQFLW